MNKVLIVSKETRLQKYQRTGDERMLKLIAEGHSESTQNILPAHAQHTASLQQVQDVLEARGIAFTTIGREALSPETVKCDLIITHGGDGTLLDASHSILTNVPVLGVNSAPGSSVGHYCLTNTAGFAGILDRILSGQLRPYALTRLDLLLNGVVLKEPVMNEVLAADRDIAGTSRYLLQIGADEEQQVSSGIFVGTPAGSTGSLSSAGCQPAPITARQLLYCARELYVIPDKPWRFRQGALAPTVSFRVVSKMDEGVLKIDGKFITYQFPWGYELDVRVSEHPLLAYINPRVNDGYPGAVKYAGEEQDSAVPAATAAPLTR